MRLEGSKDARAFARHLRRKLTPPEIKLWAALRRNDKGFRFRRQYAAGRFVLDFYCAPARLAIEIDGQAHDLGDRPLKDSKRDEWLAGEDVRVLRYPASEVYRNLDGVVAEILATALERARQRRASRHPPPPSASRPPPPGGGGFLP